MTGYAFTRLTFAAALSALALGNPKAVGAQHATFKSGVEMVPLTVTVTDVKGKPVTGLTGSDFTVLEDGVEQPLAFFGAGEVPLDVALVIDASASMGPDLPRVKTAARGLVRSLRATDRGAVVEVKDAVRIPQPLTSDRKQIEAGIHALRASGSTALYDGLYVMLKEFEHARRDSREIRRQALVLLSDGLDNTSHLLFDDVMQLARRVGVSIYVIALRGEAASIRRADQTAFELQAEYTMRTVARESGGRAFFPKAARELSSIYDTIAQELASQYELGYVPVTPGANGAFKRVLVRMKPPMDALPRTRSGYYAKLTPGVR